MDTLQISTGEKHIAINGDESRVIVFNPNDVVFAEKFYLLIGEFQQKLTQYRVRAEGLESETRVDDNDIPVNFADGIALQKEACLYFRECVDRLFGAGTSQTVFGDALNLDMFPQFFNGITPFIQQARTEKIQQYTTSASAKRNKRKNA